MFVFSADSSASSRNTFMLSSSSSEASTSEHAVIRQTKTRSRSSKFKKNKKMNPNNPSVRPGYSNMVYWTLGMMMMPVVLPLAVFNLWQKYRSKLEETQLEGKVVLITGASSGLGEALARVFYKSGCKLILAARRLNELERVRKELIATGCKHAHPPTVLALDLSDIDNIPQFADAALSIHNRVDILINNAGISVRSDVLSTDTDVFMKVMRVNYFGTVALTKALLPTMLKRNEGHVCFISSVQGKFSIPFRAAYSGSKHALQAFADALRAELSNKGVKVTTISPGYVKTQLSLNALTGTGQAYGQMDETTAKGMDPEKVARRILQALKHYDKDVIISGLDAKAAYYLRAMCPSLYFWIMERRARSQEKPSPEQ